MKKVFLLSKQNLSLSEKEVLSLADGSSEDTSYIVLRCGRWCFGAFVKRTAEFSTLGTLYLGAGNAFERAAIVKERLFGEIQRIQAERSKEVMALFTVDNPGDAEELISFSLFDSKKDFETFLTENGMN